MSQITFKFKIPIFDLDFYSYANKTQTEYCIWFKATMTCVRIELTNVFALSTELKQWQSGVHVFAKEKDQATTGLNHSFIR